jgi:hypothetical protein
MKKVTADGIVQNRYDGGTILLLNPAKYFLPNKDKSWQTTQVAEGS